MNFAVMLRGLASALGLLVLLGTPHAEAQSIKVEATQYRFIRETPRSEYPFWMNREDCLKDEKYTGEGTFIEVQPNLSPVGNYSLQVWVARGADCTDQQVRLTQGSCWKVLDEIAKINNTIYQISPRDILAAGEEVTDATCDKQVEWSTTLFFLLFNGDTLLASTKWNETQLDTKAPPPPASITASGGDNAIFLNWTITTEEQAIDAQGFAYYCAADGMEVDGVAQGGASGMGGQAAAVTCTASGLEPGVYPPDGQRCGSTGSASARSGVALSGGMGGGNGDRRVLIENGVTYGVGVAATDRVGNVGVLSPLTCATPEPVIDFFEHYKANGGRAGGGFCGISGGPGLGQSGLGTLALGAILLGFRRRGSARASGRGRAA